MAYFKASARSVDMLGRQQIAGIPNAINEIFKNSYDAYANNVRVDYLEDRNLLFIRDNGFGMTRKDFEDKWLTLGTDSKAVEGNNYKPKNGHRYVFGEKGIGRLSIATIGSSVLIVTRANRNDGQMYKIVSSFVCWSLFEIPGISIDKIPIPVIETSSMPTEEEISKLINTTKEFYISLKSSNESLIANTLDTHIRDSLNIVPFSPKDLSLQYISNKQGINENLNLENNLSGTQFYISPVNRDLSVLLSEDSFYKSDLNDLQKQMLGFSPVFLTGYKKEMNTSFWVYRKNDLFPEYNVIGENEFFSVNDYEKGDHHFEGEFDENGFFKGTISIYGKKMAYEVPWRNSEGRKPRCGKFRIRIAYFQGEKKDSLLDDSDFNYMKTKLDRVGGLYIYKDYIRILPYGDNDYDFLKLEKLRSKQASYYLFSLRRFIGAVLLSNNDNIELREKAGREGFAKNQAYYDFVSILEDFLESILIDFMREKSAERQTDVYFETKAELAKQYKIQKAENDKNDKLRNLFNIQIEDYYKRLSEKDKEKELLSLFEKIDNCIDDNLFSNINKKDQDLNNLKSALLQTAREIQVSLYLEKPNISLGSELYLKYEQYLSEYNDFLNKDLYPKRDNYLGKIEMALLKDGNKLEQDKNFQNRIDDYRMEIINIINKQNNELEQDITSLNNRVNLWKGSLQKKYIDELYEITSKVDRPVTDGNQVTKAITESEILLRKVNSESTKFYKVIKEDISGLVSLSPEDESTYSAKEALVAQGESLAELQKQLDNESELFQLGTAISIIHHEFSQTTDALKHSIEDLGVWAAANKPLEPLFKQLSASYNHLDNYLKLFTPLSKRKKIKVTDVLGKEIFQYINNLFGERANKEQIIISATDSFLPQIIHIDISTILPVYINLVDNAFFWLLKISQEKGRKIVFDTDKTGNLLIYDNGPGLDSLSKKLVFERGYTTKPGGRGLGLYISKKILNNENYDIYADDSKFETGACFVITKRGEGSNE